MGALQEGGDCGPCTEKGVKGMYWSSPWCGLLLELFLKRDLRVLYKFARLSVCLPNPWKGVYGVGEKAESQ